MTEKKVKMLTRDDCLGADDLTRELLEVPEWGGVVYVSTMPAIHRDSWECEIAENEKEGVRNIRGLLAVRTVTDQDGNRLFTDADAESLASKSASALDRIYQVASRLNRIGEKDIEELEKN